MCASLLLWLLLVTGAPLLSLGKRDSELNYVVDCDPGIDIHCNQSLTLHQIAKNLSQSGSLDVIIDINTTQLQLTGKVEFHDLESVRISGVNTTITCTLINSGLVFSNISRLTINSIALTNCGAQVTGDVQTCSTSECVGR